MTAAWREGRERGSPLGLELGLRLALYGGRTFTRVLMVPICCYFLATAPVMRAASRQFLGRVLGRRITVLDLLRHILFFGTTLLDRVYLLTGKRSRLDVEVRGESVLQEALALGRGCLLFGSHLGSFELLSVVGSVEKGHPVNVVMYHDANSRIQALLAEQVGGLPYNVIPLGEPGAMMKAKECLERGEIVGILADRVYGTEETCRMEFLGAEASFSLAPYRLASITGAPVVMAYGLFLGGRRYRVSFASLAARIEQDRRVSDDANLPWVRRYVDSLEAHAREAPFNWFNFYDYWAPR